MPAAAHLPVTTLVHAARKRSIPRAWIPIVVGVVAVGAVAGTSELSERSAHAQAVANLVVTGVATNQSSARVFFQPVAGARDYRVYDAAAPNSVKYAGLAHLTASPVCPGPFCLNHFVAQSDGVTPVFPYRVTNGATGGPQVLDRPATQIEWNSLGDGGPHTLVVEAVDQLGPVPQSNLYTGLENLPILGAPLPGGMLGSNKAPTLDGKVSTNGQGPFANRPQVIARSQPFVVQARQDLKAIPSRPSTTQAFFDSFENAENATITLTARQDSDKDSFGNLGSKTYSMNAGTPKEWTLEYRQADNINSMPFIASDHFMDMLFDGATPFTSAPTHTIYGSMSMTPRPTLDISGGKALHLTMEVDAHQSFRRWLAFDIAPAADPLQGWDPGVLAINRSDQGVFVEIKDGGCTLDIFTGPKSAADRTPTGTAGGPAHGARLWGQPGLVGGAPITCGGGEMYNPTAFSKNGFGLDDRNRFDFFLTQDHAALFEDGRLVIQSDIPAGTFPWANVPLKAYYSHYLYHSDADIVDLKTFKDNGAGLCYPLNAYWFNDPLLGTAASSNVCNASYPAGYGFPFSDERHWDNMGFEVLAGADVPANRDFSSLAASVQPPQPQAPQFVGGGGGASPTGIPTNTPTPLPTPTPNQPGGQGQGGGQPGQWVNVTPPNVNLTNPLDCSNFGASSIVSDPVRPSNLYAQFDCQGVWKSTDFGQTWTGPINIGAGGAGANGAGGGLAIAPGTNGGPPILYSSGIRGTGTGFWRSLDAGVSWRNFTVAPARGRQDVYAASVDPYDGNHLVMPAHELNAIYQSTDGGQNWSSVTLDSGMNEPGGTGKIFFINTGNAAMTRTTWIWIAQGDGGAVGTWRTTNAGLSWTKVDRNEHPHGTAQIFQPDTNGVVYMAGAYSSLGWGVLRSPDYGLTWAHVGGTGQEAIVFGTPNTVYSAYGWACGIGCVFDPNLQQAPEPGIGGWTSPGAPGGMLQGATEASVVFDGARYVAVTANYAAGLWRYVEPASGQPGGSPSVTPTNTLPPGPTKTPTPGPSMTPGATATPTPTQQPAAQAGYTSSARVSASDAARGTPVAITASITSIAGSSAAIDVQVNDESGVMVFHKLYNSESFAAGQTIGLQTQWSIPRDAPKGTYSVRIGVYSVGWSKLLNWNGNANVINVH